MKQSVTFLLSCWGMVKVVNEATGMRQLLTKREALLVCMGFKTGEAYVCGKYGINE